MGTPWSITVCATDTVAANEAIALAYERVDSVEQRMSDYRSDSEVNRLSRLPAGGWYAVSYDLYRVLDFSLELAEWSEGAFDPTVGALTRLWRRAFRQQQFPDRTEIERATDLVGFRHLQLRKNSVRLDRDRLRLDLGGVAKGYALDAAAEVLREAGFAAYLIDGGGDLLLGEPPAGRGAWHVLTPAGPIDTAHVAIATSGADFKYLEWRGTRYSHLIDPRTGVGIIDLRSVTVFAATGMLADGLASAISVMGESAWRDRPRHFEKVAVRWSVAEGYQ